jgi:hypothetical protein
MTILGKSPIIRTALVILFFVSVTSLTLILSASIDAKYRRTVLQSARFRPVLKVDALPGDIRAECFARMKVTNPEECWWADLVPRSPKSPFAHLAWAVTDGELWVVEWERGGQSYDWDVALLSKKSGTKAEVVWGRTMNQLGDATHAQQTPFKSFEEFKSSLRKINS